MKCDLHVHSSYSGNCETPIFRHFCRESYSAPEEVYATLTRRGMNLVTLTDHDSIEGAEELAGRENFFVSEEVTCRMPSGTVVHIGVYDLSERQHVRIAHLRDDFVALLAYLNEHQMLFSVNHVFSRLTGAREEEDYEWFRECFPAVEIRNGHMPAEQNAAAKRLAHRWDKVGIGGSDAHTTASAGTAYTEVRGARNKEEFLEGVRAGKAVVKGESGSAGKLARDIWLIAREMMREKSWTIALAPLALLLPAVAMMNYRSEAEFGRRWSKRILGEGRNRRRPRWGMAPRRVMEREA